MNKKCKYDCNIVIIKDKKKLHLFGHLLRNKIAERI